MHSKLMFAFSCGVLVACAATQVVQVARVDAQPRGPGEFRECVTYMLGSERDPNDLDDDARPIPAGWTVLGGAGGTLAVLCR